jgi:phage terminase large subunit-like protein
VPKRLLETVSVSDALKQLSAGIKQQAREPNIYGYTPHPKQLPFHESTAKKKLFIGGNRCGKTFSSIAEDIWWARGQHPYRKVPPAPTRGRIHGVDFLQGVQKILLPQFGRLVPPSLLKNGSWEDSYNKELRTLYFANGSFIEFMSYDQDLQKFAGTSRHFNHYDEEPPQHIFNESNARLIDTGGSYWVSMTPVDGMTWVYDTLYLNGLDDPKMFIIEVDMLDNPYIDAEAAEDFLSGLDEEERAAREHGQFIQLGGKVFKAFDKSIHVIDPIDPRELKEWQWFSSLDHGYSNPTAWIWHAVSPSNEVITFDEHYFSGMTVDEHAAKWHEKNVAHGKIPNFVVGDPAISQRSGITGTSIQTEYATHGIFIAPGNNDVAVGVARMAQYLKNVPGSDPLRPRWRITANCVNLIRELERLRWQTWSSRKAQFENNKKEKIHKKDDHASDSTRYFFTFLPDLAPQLPTPKQPGDHSHVLGAAKGRDPKQSTYDDVLAKMGAFDNKNHGPAETKWIEKAVGSDVGALEYDY